MAGGNILRLTFCAGISQATYLVCPFKKQPKFDELLCCPHLIEVIFVDPTLMDVSDAS